MALKIKRRLAAAAAAALLTACAVPPKQEVAAKKVEPAVVEEPKVESKVEKMLASAMQAFDEMDLQKELSIHREIVKLYPDDEMSVTAYYRLGQHYLNLRYYKPALKSFKEIADQFPKSPYYTDSIIGIGISRVYLKKHDKADAALREALAAAISNEQKSRVLYHMGENYYLQDRYGDALERFVECREHSGSFRNQAERRVTQIFHNFLSESELLAIAARYDNRYPADAALLELAQIYRRNGDLQRFAAIKKQIEELFPETPLPADVEASLFPEPAEPTGVRTIGCILPLSGKDAAVGNQALQGIQLAFSLNNETVERIGIRLMIKDSASNPDVAAAGAVELARDPSVIGIIGPFTNDTAESVIEPLASYSIPLFTPADSRALDSAMNEGVPIYHIGVTAQTQGRVLAELAVETLGLYRLAVIYQDDSYGERVMDSFVETATAHNADIIAVESYDPESTDFGEQIRAIGGMRDSEIREIIYNVVLEEGDRMPEEINEILEILYQNNLSIPYIVKYKELPLTQDNFSLGLKMNYDAVMIPADYDRAGLIMPELAFYNVSGIQVIGSARYASKELISLGGKYTEGVVFPGEFLPELRTLEASSFIKGFENAFGRMPDINAARAFDTVNLLLSLMERGSNSRSRLADAINTMDMFDGVSGSMRSYADSGPAKSPMLLTVKDMKIVEYQPPEPVIINPE